MIQDRFVIVIVLPFLNSQNQPLLTALHLQTQLKKECGKFKSSVFDELKKPGRSFYL
jgi:hypothetical protein